MPEGLEALKKQTLSRTIPIMLIAACAGIYITSMQQGRDNDAVNILPFYIPLIVIVMGFAIFRALKRQQLLLKSYVLKVGEDLLQREQTETPTVVIRFTDITAIVRRPNGMITINGRHKGDVINIPAHIENAAELESVLNAIQPVAEKQEFAMQRYSLLIGAISAGLMVLTYTSTNKIVMAVAGAGAIGLVIWSYFKVQHDKNVDESTKRKMNWIWLVILSVTYSIVVKLLN